MLAREAGGRGAQGARAWLTGVARRALGGKGAGALGGTGAGERGAAAPEAHGVGARGARPGRAWARLVHSLGQFGAHVASLGFDLGF